MEPFKNNISPELVICIASHLERHYPAFDRPSFEQSVLAEILNLELKQRAQLIADHLHLVLPRDFKERRRILTAMLAPEEHGGIDRSSGEDGIRGWGMLPLTMVVGQHCLDDFEDALLLLKEMTKRATAEFDVRSFLAADQERALAIMSDWVQDPSLHVRRLVSEGTRPRLPWGMQLKRLMADPSPTIPLLEALRDDPEEYVRRSVANHLNDIAKDNPDLIARLAVDWMQDAGKERRKLVRHACRTLIKQGHPIALRAFGLGPPELELTRLFVETPKVEYGKALEFSATIQSTANTPQQLIIDYVVHFKKANGRLAPKVFKWSKATLEPGTGLTLARRHPIRPITTRVYYGGGQALSLRINGKDFGHSEFELIMPD